MANKNIPDLTDSVSSFTGNELIEVYQGGKNKKSFMSTVKDYIIGLFSTDDVRVSNDGNVTHLGDVSEHFAHSSSPYVSIGGDVSDKGDGTVDITEAEVWIKVTNDLDAEFKAVVVPAANIAIAADLNKIIYIDYNAGTPLFKERTSTAGYFYSNWDEVPVATCINIGSKIIINDFKDTDTNATYKNVLGQINYQPFRYLGGLAASDGGTRNPVITAGAMLFSNDYYAISAFNTTTGGTFTRMYVTSGTWTRTTGQTQISNTQYNNVTTGLVSINNNKYVNKWLYHIKDTPSFWILLEGQVEYNDLASAQAAGIPTTLPPELNPFYAGSFLVAKFIVKQGQAAFQDIQNPFITPFSSSTASLHNNLSGLELASTSGAAYGHFTKAMYDNLPKLDASNTYSGDNTFNDDVIFEGSVTIDGITVLGSSQFDEKQTFLSGIGITALTGAYTDSMLVIDSGGDVKKVTHFKTTSTASSSTPAPTGDARENEYYLTALAAGATFAAPSGTPANGNTLLVRIKDDGTARSLAWNAIYRAVAIALPTTTVLSKTMYLGFIYNSADSKWDLVSLVNEI